jgi:hypothetical protein
MVCAATATERSPEGVRLCRGCLKERIREQERNRSRLRKAIVWNAARRLAGIVVACPRLQTTATPNAAEHANDRVTRAQNSTSIFPERVRHPIARRGPVDSIVRFAYSPRQAAPPNGTMPSGFGRPRDCEPGLIHRRTVQIDRERQRPPHTGLILISGVDTLPS